MTDKKVRCNEKVAMSNGWGSKSCSRAAVCGDKCKQHSKEAKEERAQKSHEAYLKKVAESPYKKIAQLTTSLLKAQADNARLREVLIKASESIKSGFESNGMLEAEFSVNDKKLSAEIDEALSHSSPTIALQEHDNALIEKCADKALLACTGRQTADDMGSTRWLEAGKCGRAAEQAIRELKS